MEQLQQFTKQKVEAAIAAVGSPNALAQATHSHRQAVDRWRRTGRVPAHHCIPIEVATGGAVTRYDLRPDVFGEAPTQQ